MTIATTESNLYIRFWRFCLDLSDCHRDLLNRFGDYDDNFCVSSILFMEKYENLIQMYCDRVDQTRRFFIEHERRAKIADEDQFFDYEKIFQHLDQMTQVSVSMRQILNSVDDLMENFSRSDRNKYAKCYHECIDQIAALHREETMRNYYYQQQLMQLGAMQ